MFLVNVNPSARQMLLEGYMILNIRHLDHHDA